MTPSMPRKTRRPHRRARALAGAIAAGLVALPLPANAQGEAPRDVDDVLDEGLEVLIITAEKTEKDLQKTGGSVAVFTASMLEDRGIYDVKGITDYVPNVKIHTNPGGNTGFAVNIRGAIKGDPIVSREPAVGLYIDEVYHSTMVGILFDLLDLEAIEVLRGPQGTLYGRNTNGGAIKLRTKAPTDLFTIRNDFTAGNFATWNNRTIVNMPVFGAGGDAMFDTDVLGDVNTRTAFAFLNRDGFVDLITSGTGSQTRGPRQLDDIDRMAVHHRTRWEPTSDLTVDYIFDWVDANEKPTANQLSGAFGPFVAPVPIPGLGLVNPVDISGLVTNSRIDNIALNRGADGRLLESQLDVMGHGVIAAYDLGRVPGLGDLSVKSITSKRHKENRDATDVDGTPVQIFEGAQAVDHDQFTQELQLTGFAENGWVDYVAGFYYFREKAQQTSAQEIFNDAAFAGILSPVPPLGPITNNVDVFHEVEKESFAGYAQVNVRPLDPLILTGGIRYTSEEVTLRSLYVANGFPLVDTGVGGAANASAPNDTFDKVSWLARVQVEPSDDVMAYFKVNTGFLSGGFNARNSNNANLPTPPFDPLAPAFGTPFEPEHLLSYELGVRADLFDRRARVNLTWFYYDYEDIQVSVIQDSPSAGAVTLVQNAAAASIWGVELDVLASPFEGAEVLLSYGYTHPRFDEYVENGVDVSSQRHFSQTPEHTVVAGASYQMPAFSWGTVLGRLDWSWSDEVGFNAFPSAFVDQQDSFWSLNGMLQVADLELPCDAGAGRVQLWMKNITDESYREFGFNLNSLGIAVNTYNDPRTYGMTFVWEWEK